MNGFVSLSRLGRVISVSLSLVLIGRCLLSLFSSPLFSSLLSFLLFYSPLFSSPLSVDLVATSLSHCSLSLPSLLFSPSLPLSLYLVGLVASSLPRSLSLLYWLGGCFHLLCGLGGFSFFLLCWLDYISSLCLSLSLFSLWFRLGGFSFHVCLFGGFSNPIFSCVLAGWCLLSPFCLYTLFCCLGGFLPLRLSLSLSLFLSLVLVGWGLSFLWWLGGFSPPLSCVVGRHLLSLSLSTLYSLFPLFRLFSLFC